MGGVLIVPDNIPGIDVDPARIVSAADSYRKTGAQIGTNADAALATWALLRDVYSAPEAGQLLTAMDPAGVDAHYVGSTLGSLADVLDTLAEEVAEPVRQLKLLKTEAEQFVADVRGGVSVSFGESDYPNNVTGTRAPVRTPDDVLIDWSQHTPSVAANNDLLARVKVEAVKLSVANAACVNGINGLRDDACTAPAIAFTAEQLEVTKGLPWGEPGNGDRSCSESVGDGLGAFSDGVASGVAGLVGFDTEAGRWGLDVAGHSLLGVASGLGALAFTFAAPLQSARMNTTPDSQLEPWEVELSRWQRDNLLALVGGIVGTPEQWQEDPVAASTYAIASVGTLFIPVAGQAAGGAKLAAVMSRAGLAAERLAATVGVGTHFASGLTRAGSLLDSLIAGSHFLTGRTATGSPVRSLDDLNVELLAAIPDITHPNLTPVSDVGPIPDRLPDKVSSQPANVETSGGSGNSNQSVGEVTTLEKLETRATGDAGTPGSSFGWSDADAHHLDVDGIDDVDAGPLPTAEEIQAAVDAENSRESAASFDQRVEEVHARYPETSMRDARSIANYERLIETGRYEPYVVRFFEGSIFNLENHHRYTHNEVYLDVTKVGPDGVTSVTSRTRLDSMIEGETIASRKNTQLADHPDGGLAALYEMDKKYRAADQGTVIANTPNNRANFLPDQIGQPLRGRMILEVPVQKAPVPQRVLDLADELRIEIWDVVETEYR